MLYYPKGYELKVITFIGGISAYSYIKAVRMARSHNVQLADGRRIYIHTFKKAICKFLGRNKGSRLINNLYECQRCCGLNQLAPDNLSLSDTDDKVGVNSCRLYYMHFGNRETIFHNYVMNHINNIDIQSKLLGDVNLTGMYTGFQNGEEPFIKKASKIIQSNKLSLPSDFMLKESVQPVSPKKKQVVVSSHKKNKHSFLKRLFSLF